MDKKYYMPLPDSLTIRNSSIHGLGLYATKKIEAGTRLGITHVFDKRFPDSYIRLPLGGFFDHSETPNCKVSHEDDFIYLDVLDKDIEPEEEILARYTLYDPTK